MTHVPTEVPLSQLRVGDIVQTQSKNMYSITHVGPLRAALRPLSADRSMSYASRMRLVRSAELERAFNTVTVAEYHTKRVRDVEAALRALSEGLRWVELARTRGKDSVEELDGAADTLAELQFKLEHVKA